MKKHCEHCKAPAWCPTGYVWSQIKRDLALFAYNFKRYLPWLLLLIALVLIPVGTLIPGNTGCAIIADGVIVLSVAGILAIMRSR